MQIKNADLFFFFLLFALCSCGTKKTSAEREVESENIKIKIKAGFSKKWDKGVAGGGHTPLFIPYAVSEKNWGISVTPEGYDTMTAETFQAIQTELSEEQLSDSLDNITLQFSPDKQHMLYLRKSGNTQIKEVFHFFQNKKGFVTSDTLFKDFDFAKANWGAIKPTYEIAKDIFKNDFRGLLNYYDFWVAIENQEAENEFDFLALDLFESVSSARYLIEKRNYDWNKRSDKWKNANRKLFSGILDEYENNYKRDPLISYSIKSMILKAADEELDKKFINMLAERLDDRRNDEDIEAFFSDPNRKNRLEEMRKPINKNLTLLLKAGKTADLTTVWRVARIISDSAQMKNATQKLLAAWSEHPIAGTFFQNNFEELSPAEQQSVLEFVEKNIDTDCCYIIACNLLEDYAACDKLDALSKKHKGKIKKRANCK